jgi:hypothetical protein
MVPRTARGAGPGDYTVSEQGVDDGIPLGGAETSGSEHVGLAGAAVAGGNSLSDGLQGSGIRDQGSGLALAAEQEAPRSRHAEISRPDLHGCSPGRLAYAQVFVHGLDGDGRIQTVDPELAGRVFFR